jgi:hypothetical protein
MDITEHWSVDIYLDERENETRAEALIRRDREELRGRGRARRHPGDWNVPQIGAELAASRALADLAHKLLDTAAADIEEVTHERVRLTH